RVGCSRKDRREVFLYQQQNQPARTMDSDYAAPDIGVAVVDAARPRRQSRNSRPAQEDWPQSAESHSRVRLRRVRIASADVIVTHIRPAPGLRDVVTSRLRVGVDQ